MELYQWAHYIHAYGPLNQGARIFARLDAGFASLYALMINRTGGLAPHLNAKPEAVKARDYMWEPGPEPAPPPQTVADKPQAFASIFGINMDAAIKAGKRKAEARAAKAARAKAAEDAKRGT